MIARIEDTEDPNWVRVIYTDKGPRLKRREDVFRPRARPYEIIPDLKPYKAVAGDMAGKWITGRKEHREFLKRNGFEEVGNEYNYMTRNPHGMKDDHPYVERLKWLEKNPELNKIYQTERQKLRK